MKNERQNNLSKACSILGAPPHLGILTEEEKKRDIIDLEARVLIKHGIVLLLDEGKKEDKMLATNALEVQEKVWNWINEILAPEIKKANEILLEKGI